MGDRANIVIKCGDEQVCLYTHWDGSDLDNNLRKAMSRGISRWDDFQYLTRIIFCEMIKENVDGTTGFGITQKVHDGDSNVITVDVDNSNIVDAHGREFSFEEYVKE